MKNLIIPFSNSIDNNFATANINIFKWCNNDYKPDTKAYLAYNSTKILVKLISYEADRKATFTEDESKVHLDSCLEFFVQPFNSDERYLNFEFNPNGSTVLHIGRDRKNRGHITNLYKNLLNVQTISEQDYWGISFEIPFSMLCDIYAKEKEFCKGYKFKGNFYKCGDECKFTHYGMWNDILLENADFHVSKFFGNIILG